MTTTSQQRLLRAVGIAVAVTAAAAASGAGSGLLLSKASGDEVGTVATLTNPATAPQVTDAAGASVSPTPSGTTPARTVTLTVRDGRIVPPSTAAGRERRRLSIRVTVAVRNTGSRPRTLGRFSLTSGSTTVGNDTRALDPARGLLGRIRPGEEKIGELRFETSGTESEAFEPGQVASVGVAGESATVRLTLAPVDQ